MRRETPAGDAQTEVEVEVVRAQLEDARVIANLLELYAHDFSEFSDMRIGADGRFGYPPLPLYWQDPGRSPFLIRAGGDLAGFALIRQESQISGASDVWDVTEFFILRGWRRRHVGATAACALWRRHPGPWEVRVQERNVPARSFWQRTVESFTGEPARASLVEAGGKRWHVLSFVSR